MGISKGLLYYTCNTHPLDIEMACRAQLARAKDCHELGCVSREKATHFGDWELVVPASPSILTMHYQILYGLRAFKTDVIFLCENDVLYHPSHFDFTPVDPTIFYYNTNVWRARYPDGHVVWTDDLQQVSGLCAWRRFLLSFYEKRIVQIESGEFDRHYEPGPKTGPYHTANWKSEFPNIDIRHSKNLTKSKWSPQDFRNKRYARGWKEDSCVEGWGETEGRFNEFLKEITYG